MQFGQWVQRLRGEVIIGSEDFVHLEIIPALSGQLITVPFIENVNKFQNPFRRPIASLVFIFGTFTAFWLGIGATMPISQALTLGFF